MFAKRQGEEKQQEFWIEAHASLQASEPGFYSKLNEHLEAMDFARQVWALCEPAYREESRGGRPGIDPVVYFKMLMVGFFENCAANERSRRAVRTASRCGRFWDTVWREHARSQQPGVRFGSSSERDLPRVF